MPSVVSRSVGWLSIALLCGASAALAGDASPFVGNWALNLPNGGAGWLGVTQKEGKLQAEVLWGGGSVLPVAGLSMEGDQLRLVRSAPLRPRSAKNPQLTVQAVANEIVTARVSGDTIRLTLSTKGAKGNSLKKSEFSGQRIPPVGPAPDLSKVKFAAPIELFNGKDLAGWEPTRPGAINGWSVKHGLLVDEAPQEPGKPRKAYANLRTVQEFEDFNLTLETRVPKDGNSGIYLRGIYEVQVFDSYGKPLDSHNMGAIYSRICPTKAAEKPVGQWNTFDITLLDRHVTVILNGTKIIDNQPLLGCTGGALWPDQFRPGPIFLQGDHTSIEYRNIVIRPVLK